MKIGIITYHRAENYGALLQAFALRTYLQGLGHDVSFVDYWPQYHVDYFKIFTWNRFIGANWKGKIDLLIGITFWLCPRITRSHRLKRFMGEKLGVVGGPKYNETTKTTEHYDIVVYGSDQIWRKQNMGGVGFDEWYFGADNVQADRKIVYAGSMGTIRTTKEDDDYVQRMMQNFQAISVRESDLQSYLKSLHVSSSVVIDPVFLLSKEQWLEVTEVRSNKQKKYILFYNLLNNPDSERFANQLSMDTELPIKEVNKKMSLHHLNKRYISTPSVSSFLRMIHDAEYVVSNSFHGVAFSLIFQKQFFAVGMGERANRVMSLLSIANLKERYITDSSISPKNFGRIDYNAQVSNVKEMIAYSKSYLNNYLEK